MAEKKIYNTKQRDQLLSFFKEHREKCFSSKELINESGINIGEATLYRYLAKFTEEGILNRYTGDSESKVYYQIKNCNSHDEHFHLKCTQCGRLLHSDCKFMKDMDEHFKNVHDFSVDNTKTVIYGICKDCKDTGNSHE
ncbi:MAG: transcriptional repressor [Clostridia bacterium]|jgi:Fur family ferric uptake transcriptional regulator